MKVLRCPNVGERVSLSGDDTLTISGPDVGYAIFEFAEAVVELHKDQSLTLNGPLSLVRDGDV